MLPLLYLDKLLDEIHLRYQILSTGYSPTNFELTFFISVHYLKLPYCLLCIQIRLKIIERAEIHLLILNKMKTISFAGSVTSSVLIWRRKITSVEKFTHLLRRTLIESCGQSKTRPPKTNKLDKRWKRLKSRPSRRRRSPRLSRTLTRPTSSTLTTTPRPTKSCNLNQKLLSRKTLSR